MVLRKQKTGRGARYNPLNKVVQEKGRGKRKHNESLTKNNMRVSCALRAPRRELSSETRDTLIGELAK